MFCSKCGAEIKNTTKFCPKCGAAIEKANISQDNNKVIVESAIDTPVSMQVAPKKGKSLGIIIGVFLGILIIAASVWLVLNGGNEPTTALGGGNTDDAQTIVPAKLSIVLNQIDNSQFPNMIVYATIKDEFGKILYKLPEKAFQLSERLNDHSQYKSQIIEMVRQNMEADPIKINMVIDRSGSMNELNKISKVQTAAKQFLSKLQFGAGDEVEIIEFDSTPRVSQLFTSDYNKLENAIDKITPDGQTALYDALYTALIRTSTQNGAKYIVVFTDGIENGSVNCTAEDVIELSIKTGIPIYMIGIGGESDEQILSYITSNTGGQYFNTEWDGLDTQLRDTYLSIYNEQKSQYVIEYISDNINDKESTREVQLTLVGSSGIAGSSVKEFVPVTIINDDLHSSYNKSEYIFSDSSSRSLTENDLDNLSLVELRIARNEIFARHGRLFRDRLLTKWFFSKEWYIDIYPKYEPEYFDKNISLSNVEQDNVKLIQQTESNLLSDNDIFIDSSHRRLTEWDVSLSKQVLLRARSEIYQRAGIKEGDLNSLNEIERYNVELIDARIKQIEKGAQ